MITGVINAFNVFEQVNVMTGGGPMNATTTIVHQIYTRALQNTGWVTALRRRFPAAHYSDIYTAELQIWESGTGFGYRIEENR